MIQNGTYTYLYLTVYHFIRTYLVPYVFISLRVHQQAKTNWGTPRIPYSTET